MMEEKEGVKKQNSKKGFEKNEHACIVEGFFADSDSTAHPSLKLTSSTKTYQSFSKFQQFRK